MSNLQNNRLSASITAADIAEIKQAAALIESKLPFLLGLTVEERMAMPKISRQNKLFVGDALQACVDNGGILPGYVNVNEMKKDFALYLSLAEIVLPIAQLSEKLRDTQMLAGSEAYTTALAVYKMFQMAAASGMPGLDTVVEQLSERFASQGNQGDVPESDPSMLN